jgi:hypothetical protein
VGERLSERKRSPIGPTGHYATGTSDAAIGERADDEAVPVPVPAAAALGGCGPRAKA